MDTLPVINAFWVGPKMGPLHAACLKSFTRHGHRVVLHTYNSPPEDTPAGVEIADANDLLSHDKVVRHDKSGSLALASDLFRYNLMAAGAGIYVDCDCYCVRPLTDADYILGWESDQKLGTAVLKLPPDSPLLETMLAIGTTSGFIPPWEKPARKLHYRLRSILGAPVPLSRMKWGAMGPPALTHYTKAHALTDKAGPIDAYYPIHYHQVSLLFNPDLRLRDLTTPRTAVVHLWNKFLHMDGKRPPAGSPLAEIIDA